MASGSWQGRRASWLVGRASSSGCRVWASGWLGRSSPGRRVAARRSWQGRERRENGGGWEREVEREKECRGRLWLGEEEGRARRPLPGRDGHCEPRERELRLIGLMGHMAG